MKTRPAAPILLVLALAAFGCSGRGKPADSAAKGPAPAGQRPAPRKVPVAVQTVAPRALAYSIDAVGQLAANEVVRIPARVPGIVEDVRFDVGMAVQRGTLLARIDSERYRLAVKREVAQVAEARASAEVARASLQRRRGLKEKNAEWVTAEELETFSSRVDQAEATLAAAQAALDLARKDLRDSEVRADMDGVIDQRLVDPGQQVVAGTTLATIVDASRLRLAFKVAESESARLGSAPTVSFRLKSHGDRSFTATLAHVGQSADPATRQVECLAWVDDPAPELKPGFFAEVTIDVGTAEMALVVPQTAILPTERGLVAFVVDAEGLARERKVTLGLQTAAGEVEVLQGLAAGETVVVRGASALREGAAVAITESPT